MLLNFADGKRAFVPDFDQTLLDNDSRNGTITAQLRGQVNAFFARECDLKREILSSVHHTVRHPLMRVNAHQSICDPDGA